MAPSYIEPAPTRPQLQSINQDFSDLDEQLRQAAHIIGLPDDWAIIDEASRAEVIRRLVRARAEWVLRWILDKLKDEGETGKTARGNFTAWKLLEWMIHVLPVSRSAPHLRDADFPFILERTLLENFDKDSTLQPASTPDDLHTRDISESSETTQENTQPSRKRKRGTTNTTSSPRLAQGATHRDQLFCAVRSAVAFITTLAVATNKSDDPAQAELMKMVLRTESAQASRIMRFWFTSVHQMITTASASAVHTPNLDQYLDLSLVVEIWELRNVDPKDEAGASADDFSAECLIPTLTLLDGLRTTRRAEPAQFLPNVIDQATQTLDKLLARHLLAPARAAFSADATIESAKSSSNPREAKALAGYLEPLRAKLLQAAQIEDAGESLPAELAFLFDATPCLLDLAIRASPSRTPKGRLAEKSWIQATFQTLAECAGCPLIAPPVHVTHSSAVAALEGSIRVLQLQNASIDSEILKTLFWYHCGVKYPEHKKKAVHWSLIASLIELDPSVFVIEPNSNSETSQQQHNVLTDSVFEQISVAEINGHDFNDDEVLDNVDLEDHHPGAGNQITSRPGRSMILQQIIVPLMMAFARNRNLLGFLRRWDSQLVRSYRHENKKALQERITLIWEDRSISNTLIELFEQSLTQGQIASLIEEHVQRMTDLGDSMEAGSKDGNDPSKHSAYKKASSSAFIIPALLQSIQSDETIHALQPHLHSLFLSYTTWVKDDRYRISSRLAFSWFTLCQLLEKLWPYELHGSLTMQQELLHPLVEQAADDMSVSRKDQNGGRADFVTRTAAMSFLLNACHQLGTVGGSDTLVEGSVRRATKCLSSSQLEPKERHEMTELFCANFATLLEHLNVDVCRRQLLTMMSTLSELESDHEDLILNALSDFIIYRGNPSLRNTYTTTLLDILEQDNGIGRQTTIITTISHIPASAFSKEQTESILNLTTELLSKVQNNSVGLLGVMVQFSKEPNATARVWTDGRVIFTIAEQLHKNGTASPTTLYLFRQLVQSILRHVVSNQNESQSVRFREVFRSKLDRLIKSPKRCSAAGLSILRVTTMVQVKLAVPYLGRYVELLKQWLENDDSGGDDSASRHEVLDAFNELTSSALEQEKIWDSTQAWLRTWVNTNFDFESYIGSKDPSAIEQAEYVARLYTTVARFRLYPRTKWLIDLTMRFLREPISDDIKRRALESLKETLATLSTAEKLDLVPALTEPASHLQSVNPDKATLYGILSDLITTFRAELEVDAGLKLKQLGLLPTIAMLLAQSPDYACFNALLSSINIVLDNKRSFVSQYSIESVLRSLTKCTSRSSPALSIHHAPEIFGRLCETFRLIFLVHRIRLRGRFHLVLPLLQGLLLCLFIPYVGRSSALPGWLRSVTATEPVRLTAANANHYSHLLSTLCNPPHSSVAKAHQQHASQKSKELNDPVKAAREEISPFLYTLLTSFCRDQLMGRLDAGVREKLMPGVWEVMGTAALHKETLDAMFAGLGRSERDVWRGVWAEWETLYGRKSN